MLRSLFRNIPLLTALIFLQTLKSAGENDLWQAFLRLSLNFSTQRWQYRLSHIEQRFEDEQERTQDTRNSSANVTWRDDDLLVSDIDANLNLQRNEFSEQADASVQWETYRGRASLSADRSSFDGGQSASYSAALSTTFVGDKDGVVVGGSDINQAAVLVELDSPDIEGSYFDVLVDNAKRSYCQSRQYHHC